MENDFENRINVLEQKMREHYHNGIVGRQIDIRNVLFFIKTVTSATELTNILASTPRKFTEQILIDTTTATKKLYIYDSVGHVWRSVTIS